MNEITNIRISETGEMAFYKGNEKQKFKMQKKESPKYKVNDIVFSKSDLKKELPIRITSIGEKNNSIFYFGRSANWFGRLRSKKYNEDILNPATK